MASQQHKRARDGAAPSPLASSAHQPVSKKRRSRASVKKQRRKSASSSRNQPAAGAGGGCDSTSGSGSAASMAERGSTLPFGVAGHGSARDIGARVFAHLIAPMSVETFLKTYWEKKPLLVRRSDPSYYKGIMSSARVHSTHDCAAALVPDFTLCSPFCFRGRAELLKQRKLTYEKDVDVTRYKDGAREFRNRSGIADASRVWKMFTEQGFSVRLLCPHAHVEPLWRLLAALEDFFGCFCGCNTYLTPRATQGFPPHCDDIEAFLMQVEGEKRWRVYAPLDDEGYLPRAAKAFTGVRLPCVVVQRATFRCTHRPSSPANSWSSASLSSMQCSDPGICCTSREAGYTRAFALTAVSRHFTSLCRLPCTKIGACKATRNVLPCVSVCLCVAELLASLHVVSQERSTPTSVAASFGYRHTTNRDAAGICAARSHHPPRSAVR